MLLKPLKLETLKRFQILPFHYSTLDKILQESTINGFIYDDLLLSKIIKLENK